MKYTSKTLPFFILAISLLILSCSEKKRISDFEIKINSPNLPSQLYQIEEDRFNSKILGANQKILIFRPKSINSKDSVKILYLLDGPYSTDRLQTLRMRFKDFDSEFIVVGITNSGNISPDNITAIADKYLLFLTEDVIPRAEKDYSRVSRIILGHSSAADFTIYTLLAKPGYFSAYYAINPGSFSHFIKDIKEVDTVSLKKAVLNVSANITDSAKVQNEFSHLIGFLVENKHINLRSGLEFYNKTSFLDEVIKTN